MKNSDREQMERIGMAHRAYMEAIRPLDAQKIQIFNCLPTKIVMDGKGRFSSETVIPPGVKDTLHYIEELKHRAYIQHFEAFGLTPNPAVFAEHPDNLPTPA